MYNLYFHHPITTSVNRLLSSSSVKSVCSLIVLVSSVSPSRIASLLLAVLLCNWSPRSPSDAPLSQVYRTLFHICPDQT